MTNALRHAVAVVVVWLALVVVALAQPGQPTEVTIQARYIPASGGPSITVTSTPTTAARYGKLEWTLTLGRSYPNLDYPYDAADTFAANPAGVSYVEADGVTVNLTVTKPNAATVTVPCFGYTPYGGVEESSTEIFGATGTPRVACRFAGEQVGTYTYTISAQDAGGTTTTGSSSFTVTDGSNPGYVRVSTTDARYFKTDDGRSWMPVGAGGQWPNPVANQTRRAYDVVSRIGTYAANNGNFTRFWDSSEFAISVEGVTGPVWKREGTSLSAAQGVELNTGNQHAGLRSAKPVNGNGWYQSVYLANSTSLHRLIVWARSTSATSCQALVRATATTFNSGTTLASSTSVTGTTAWTVYTTTFTPNDTTVAVNLVSGASGTCLFDDVQLGPDDGAGGVTYNALSDGDFERHFYKDNPSNDPNATPSLARPIGTWFAPWATYEMDLIVDEAQAQNFKIQMCLCSGPWWIWPTDPQVMDETFLATGSNAAWVLRYYKRSYRNRIARWGWSTAVHSWEFKNEVGHTNSSATPQSFTLWSSLTTYIHSADPFGHPTTISQNSQAYSPQLNSQAIDVAQMHWYEDGHIPTLDSDEALTLMRFGWCMHALVAPGSSPYCTTAPSLGLGDGSAWSGGAKPLIIGEIGAATDPSATTRLGITGTAGARWQHNTKWAAAFSPAMTAALEWWWYEEDAGATAAKLAAMKAIGAYFADIDIESGGLTSIHTLNDMPGSTGTMTTSDTTNSRAYGFRRSDQTAAYVWVQNKGYTYSNAGSITATAPTITVNNLKNSTVYRVSYWDTTTGLVTSTSAITSNGSGVLSVPIASMSATVAFKAIEANWPQFQVTEQRTGSVPETTDGSYSFQWAWIGPSTTETSLPLSATTSPLTIAGRVQPVVQNGRAFIASQDGNAYGITLSTGANAWTRALDGGVLTTGAVRNNIVVFATVAGTVYGLNATTGAILWQTDVGAAMTAEPLLSTTKIIVATHAGTVVALNIFDGRILWTSTPNGNVPIDGGIAADGSFVYVLDEAMYAHKLNIATGASAATMVRLKGRSAQACNPVVAGGKVWFTTFMTHSQGSEFVAEDLFAASGDLAAEEANIATWLAGGGTYQDRSVDWQHRFAVTISDWTIPFTPLVMPSEGTGHPPPSMVVDNSGAVLVMGKTRYPSLVGNNGSVFGTAYSIDIFRINQSTGARTTVGGGTRNSFPWETDNLCAMTVAGGELWCNSRFRGTTAWRNFATSSTRTMVRNYVAVEDGSNNCPGVFGMCYKNGTDTPRISTTTGDLQWWPSVVVVGGRVIISEDFGLASIQ